MQWSGRNRGGTWVNGLGTVPNNSLSLLPQQLLPERSPSVESRLPYGRCVTTLRDGVFSVQVVVQVLRVWVRHKEDRIVIGVLPDLAVLSQWLCISRTEEWNRLSSGERSVLRSGHLFIGVHEGSIRVFMVQLCTRGSTLWLSRGR